MARPAAAAAACTALAGAASRRSLVLLRALAPSKAPALSAAARSGCASSFSTSSSSTSATPSSSSPSAPAPGAPPPPRAAPAGAPRRGRLTGFQKSVLALYRDCLAAARRLPTRERAAAAAAYVRAEFRAKAASVDKLDIQRVEFLTRQARRKLASYTAAGVDAVGLSFTRGGADAGGGAGVGAGAIADADAGAGAR